MTKVVLITGATGQQGGAVVDALLAATMDPPLTILALTRKPDSKAAKAVASKSHTIQLIKGDLDDPRNIFVNAATYIWGVFSVQVSFGMGANPGREERQGKALIDAALENHVKHFLYSSVDRGTSSDSDPTNVPQFAGKHRIEKHLQEKAAGTNMTWTIFRLVGYMENLNPGFVGKATVSMWKSAISREKSLQFIALADVGHFVAQAFLNPNEYNNRTLSLAGDELTYAQAEKVFREKTGNKLPATFGFIAWAILKGVRPVRLMFKWFDDVGTTADIAELKAIHPELMTFADWLENKSGFVVRKS